MCQSEAELKIQDGWPWGNKGVYCFPNSRWLPQILANQKPNKEFIMVTSTKVGHVENQPTSLNGELGSVSRFSMATRIEQIDNRIKNGRKLTWSSFHHDSRRKREKWMRVVIYKTRRKAGRDGNIIGNQSETYDDVMASQSPLAGRALSSRPFPFPSHLPCFHAGMFNEMYHTVSNSSSSCKGVMRHAKFILKPKIQTFQCNKLERVLSN